MLKHRFWLCLTCVFFAGTQTAAAQFEALLITGQTPASAMPDERFESFGDDLVMSSSGRVAVLGTSVSLTDGIHRGTAWVRDLEGNWSVAAGAGITVFEIDGEETSVQINNHGELLLQKALFDTGEGVVVGDADHFTTLGIEGTALPDGTIPGTMDALGINDRGNVVLSISVAGESGPGLWVGSATQSVQRLVPVGANGQDIWRGRFLLQDNQDRVYFSGASGSESGVYRVDTQTGMAHPVAAFENAPGVAEQVGFSTIDRLVIDEQGAFAFSARLLRENGVTSESESGIWRSNPDGSVSLIAREGGPAPDGTQFGEFGQSFALDDGRLFFTSDIRSGHQGIVGRRYWTASGSGQLTSFSLQHGDEAPDDAGDISFFRDDGMSDSGRNAFIASIDGNSRNHRLYYQNEIGEFETIAYSGQEVQITPGDVRTVSGLDEILQFQDDRLLFQLEFTDGSEGIFLTAAATTPPDYDGDGVVTLRDLTVVQAGLGAQYDRHDMADVVRSLGQVFGPQPSPIQSAVPEPSSLALWLLACSVMLGRARRNRA